MKTFAPKNRARILTGVSGFDDILGGGLLQGRSYLIEGDPGTGKTTFAFHFLLEAKRLGERALYITLSESKDELMENAASHGFDLSGVDIFELPSDDQFRQDSQNTFFHSSELELGATNAAILAEFARVKPQRVIFDSVSEMKVLSKESTRFRRQILSIKQHFTKDGATVLLLDDLTATLGGKELQSIVHGVIRLENLSPEYGSDRRRMRITKLRGMAYRGGYHDYLIERGGIEVFPRLIANEHGEAIERGVLPSGIKEIDQLFCGGIHRGTSTLLMGPAGSGKSSIALQFAVSACERGERAEMFIFDEGLGSLLMRASGMGFPLEKYIDKGLIHVTQVDPAEISPGEFSGMIRDAVEKNKASVIVIDSLNGYLNAMPDEKFLLVQMHENVSYLNQMGVATFVTVAQHGLLGSSMESVIDVSYLADAVILLRYFEVRGEVKQAVSVVKRRSGPHERTIRELRLSSKGIHVGEALREFRGVLSGAPIVVEEKLP